MFYHARNSSVPIGSTQMDYISFGSGPKNLIMIPGLGDGLKTAKGTAIPFAMLYREYARDYKVYVFSRKNRMEMGYTTKDMARDQKEAMDRLGITGAAVIGISQGGMIAQHLTADYPEAVEKLVLAVTSPGQNKTLQNVVSRWITMAREGDYKHLLIDTAERSYSEEYLKKYRRLYPFLGLIGRPKDFSRFLIQANACLTHDSRDALGKITCPTLVIGGGNDRIVGTRAVPAVAAGIPQSQLVIYPNLGHMAYEEAKDFNSRVLDFLSARE